MTDRKGAIQAIEKHRIELAAVTCILADGGYSDKPFSQTIHELLGAQVQIAKRNELHTFSVMPKRWIVERPFAWIEKCRRLWKNCERLLTTSLQFLHLAFLLKRL